MYLRFYVGIIVFKYMDVCVNGVDIRCFMVNLQRYVNINVFILIMLFFFILESNELNEIFIIYVI